MPTQSHIGSPNTVQRFVIIRDFAPGDREGRIDGPSADSYRPESEPRTPSFLELCVDHEKRERRLGEVDLTNILTDSQLFEAINEKYMNMRRRPATLNLLRPATVHFVKVC